MSLFGDSTDDLPRRNKQSALFDDDHSAVPAARPSPSLFADDLNEGGDSPWAFPTPKKAARSSLVKSLLQGAEVPESYVDAFDALIASGDHTGNGVSLTGVKKLLVESGVDADTQAKILDIVLSGGQEPAQGIGRNEFNVFMALVGLAQEGEDVTLDGVDERRRNLPHPRLASIKQSSQPKDPETPQAQQSADIPTTPTPAAKPTPHNMRKTSFGFPETDPWGAPELHRGHNHQEAKVSATQSNGTNGLTGPSIPTRTTSDFTTASAQPISNQDSDTSRGRASVGDDSQGWGGFGASTGEGFDGSTLGGDAFGGSTSGQGSGGHDPTGLGRSLGGGRVAHHGVEEVVTVSIIPEKEGAFMFQHHNYQVTSARRNSKVVRRYSDFVWLLDCLHKRYPFRQLPLLPPKRVAINGNYIAADKSFIEKRRRGLTRFANTLVRHPVLSQETLVVMFLTVPTELAVWRKQATISVQEEFVGKVLPPALEDSLPPTLQDLFDTVRSGVRRSAEIYINLCNLMERLAKRNEGIGAEYLRFSQGLLSLVEASSDTYAIDRSDVAMLNEGMNSTAKHLSQSQALLEDEAKAWDEGVLEDLKRQRDCLVSVRDMFERRDKYSKDNIPQLEKRIQTNEAKLANIRTKPQDLLKVGEAEKVEEAIFKDKQSIVNQHARGVFIKECIRDELIYFQQSQYHVSKLHQDWSQERVKYAELQADNWRGLSEEVEGMPLGE